MNDICGLFLQPRSRDESNMASDLKEKMQIESESPVDIFKLLPRDGPVSYHRYGSLVAEEESPDTQENVDEADACVETEVVREHFSFCLVCSTRHFNFSCVY